MTTQIHPTAIIENGAEIGDNVTIGPYCTIGRHVKIGEGTSLKSHVVVDGHTTIGNDNKIFLLLRLALILSIQRIKAKKVHLLSVIGILFVNR